MLDDSIPMFVDITKSAIFGDIPIGSFISVRDFDNDGLDDILIDNRLLKNISVSGIIFIDVTEDSGIINAAGHGTFIDMNNDLCPDIIFYGQRQGIQIFKNNCDGSFIKITDPTGLERCTHTEAITYSFLNDYIFPIIYCANYEFNGRYFRDALYASNGDNTFYDVSFLIRSQIFSDATPSRCAVSADFNNDSLIDLYVCNYRLYPNLMLINANNVFSNEAFNLNTASMKIQGGKAFAGSNTIGMAAVDLDNDGINELIVANLAHNDYERGRYSLKSQILKLYHQPYQWQTGYKDVRLNSGICVDEVGSNINGLYKDELFSGVVGADFNNDSYMDLAFTQVYDTTYSYLRFYTGVDDTYLRFADSTFASGVFLYDSMGIAYSDLNKDGCLDIITAGKKRGDKNRRLFIFENLCSYKNNFVKFRLIGNRHNLSAIGSRVNLVIKRGDEERVLSRYVESTNSGFGQQNSNILHFGIGKDATIERVEIHWNSGTFQLLYNYKLNGLNTVLEPNIDKVPKIEDLIKYDEENYYVKTLCNASDDCFLYTSNACSNQYVEAATNLIKIPQYIENFCKNYLLIINEKGVGSKYLVDQ